MSGAGEQASLVVAICTYERPQQLARLLDLLPAALLTPPPDIRIVVIDNSPSASARPTVLGRSKAVECAVKYVHEPDGGIVGARNAALRARRVGEDLAFIDDDEWPSEAWLTELWQAHELRPSAIVAGPTHRVRHGGSFDGVVYAPEDVRLDGQQLEACGFGNVLIPAALLDEHQLVLAERYSRSGGEDTEFCLRARRYGSEVRFCAEAVCYEETGDERLEKGFRRRLVLTQHAIYSDVVRRHHPLHVARRAATSLVRVLGSLIALPWSAMRGRAEPTLLQLCAGVGGLLGLCGFLPSRY